MLTGEEMPALMGAEPGMEEPGMEEPGMEEPGMEPTVDAKQRWATSLLQPNQPQAEWKKQAENKENQFVEKLEKLELSKDNNYQDL